jgi:CheY-like chemotaxis protein
VILRDIARGFLSECGYHILDAGSGRAALQVWGEHRAEIDMLLTDMKMPEGISGLELAEKMIAEQPSLRVIFTSGYSDDLIGPEVLARCNAQFLAKPYACADLIRIVRETLDQKNAVAAG